MKIVSEIAVLITCHNRIESTISCLNALFNCRLPNNINIEVFLVDDGSTDGTSEAVKNNFPRVNLIAGKGNLFWNRGMHLAWEKAKNNRDFDFYLWLNDDTILKFNAIDVLLHDSELKNNQSIICGVCQSVNSDKITYGGYDESNHKKIIPNGYPQICYFFNGNIVLVPRIVFQRIGNLDNYFHHQFGDFDYGLRALKKNISSWISSEIIGYCEDEGLKKWCNPTFTFLKRLKVFYTPLGMSPLQHFIYANRHWGTFKAIKSFIMQHIRLIFPSVWIKNNT